MNNLFKSLGIILVITIFYSCEEKPTPPVISTTTVTQISTIEAVSGGNITDDGGAPITSKGVCWNTADNPTIENNKTTESGESLSFTSILSQLIPSTSYYVRAYAVNSAGTSYGKSVAFKTLGDKPASSSQNASNIQLTTATLNGTVNPNYLSTEVTFEYGMTTSYGSSSVAQQSPVTGDTDASVSADITELLSGSTYHFRIKAENTIGITYSSDMTFTTLGTVPSTSIETATNIQVYSATVNGSVNPNYLSTEVTFEWGATTNYGNITPASQSPLTGSTPVNVTADLSSLAPGTTYHFRINANNELGTTISDDLTFTTLGAVPTTSVLAATNLQVYSATLNGSVNPKYLSSTIEFEWGTTSNYGNIITPSQSPVTGNVAVNISTDLSGLTSGTTYHFRVNATNELGTTNSEDLTFTTLGSVPTTSVLAATNLQVYSATLNGSVNPNYLSSTIEFEWGTTSSYGNTITPSQSPVTGNTAVNISTDLSGLTPGTTYHFRVNATNELGTTNSEDLTFTTLGSVPTTSVLVATNLQVNSATLNGSVNPNYLSSVVEFEWGNSTSYGNTIIPSQSPVTGNTPIGLSIDLSGLAPETTYHFTISATNELGTTKSDDMAFTTYAVTDADNNLYHSITIGTQTWIKGNLKTTHYNTDTEIPLITDNTTWSNLTTPGYCWYNNDKTLNNNTYGALYNWYAVSTGNLCPLGWHIPSDAEWTVLIDYLGGVTIAGGKLKETSTTHWRSPNANATDESGFTALPGGNRDLAGPFYNISDFGYWWSSSEASSSNAWYKFLYYNDGNVGSSDYGKTMGFSVRCIKD